MDLEMNKENVFVMTYTGKMVNPFKPDEEQICIEDIAHSLARQCRFNGHTKKFYSVAEHSINVALKLEFLGFPARTVLLGLLHDSAEAYLSDIPSPVKGCFPELVRLEDELENSILKKLHPQFGDLSINDFYYVNLVDKEICIEESKKLLGKAEWNNKETIFEHNSFDIVLSPEKAEKAFIEYYKSLLEVIARG